MILTNSKPSPTSHLECDHRFDNSQQHPKLTPEKYLPSLCRFPRCSRCSKKGLEAIASQMKLDLNDCLNRSRVWCSSLKGCLQPALQQVANSAPLGGKMRFSIKRIRLFAVETESSWNSFDSGRRSTWEHKHCLGKSCLPLETRKQRIFSKCWQKLYLRGERSPLVGIDWS